MCREDDEIKFFRVKLIWTSEPPEEDKNVKFYIHEKLIVCYSLVTLFHTNGVSYQQSNRQKQVNSSQSELARFCCSLVTSEPLEEDKMANSSLLELPQSGCQQPHNSREAQHIWFHQNYTASDWSLLEPWPTLQWWSAAYMFFVSSMDFQKTKLYIVFTFAWHWSGFVFILSFSYSPFQLWQEHGSILKHTCFLRRTVRRFLQCLFDRRCRRCHISSL